LKEYRYLRKMLKNKVYPIVLSSVIKHKTCYPSSHLPLCEHSGHIFCNHKNMISQLIHLILQMITKFSKCSHKFQNDNVSLIDENFFIIKKPTEALKKSNKLKFKLRASLVKNQFYWSLKITKRKSFSDPREVSLVQ
jgi:hypothetical protein